MAHSEICPICGGTGKKESNTTLKEEICHGCGGKGWIEVQDNSIYPYPVYPIYPSYPQYPYYPWITCTITYGGENT